MTETPAIPLENLDPESGRRWRLILGAPAHGLCPRDLSADDAAMDTALAALYESGESTGKSTRGGLGASAPNVARWLDVMKKTPNWNKVNEAFYGLREAVKGQQFVTLA